MPDLPAQLLDLPVAHAGHWIVWVLYALPVVAVCVALWISSRRGGSPEAVSSEARDRERQEPRPPAD